MPSFLTSNYSHQCWRILTPRWSFDPLSGAGSAKNGGRFNRPGQHALYLSEEVETALAEYQQNMLRTPKPGMLAAYTVDIDEMIDLTDSNTLSSLGIDNKALECPWKILRSRGEAVPTWDLVDRLIADGVAGARVSSFAAAGGINVVLWDWQAPPNVVNVSDPDDDLPKNQSSWAKP